RLLSGSRTFAARRGASPPETNFLGARAPSPASERKRPRMAALPTRRIFRGPLQEILLLPAEELFAAVVGEERSAVVQWTAEVGGGGQILFDRVARGAVWRRVVGADNDRLAAEAVFLDAKTADGGEVARVDERPEIA